MFYMKNTRKLLILLIMMFLGCLFIGCNDSDSDSDNPKSFDAETTWYRDADGDGYGDPTMILTQTDQPVDYVSNSSDCSDSDPEIYPGALELCDGKDNNCSGVTDENACEPESQKISGRITNLNDAQAYINGESYLQLVPYPADGQMVFAIDEQERRVYTSDLATIDMPPDGAFLFETFALIPGQYVIAAQRLDSYGPDCEEIPVLSDAEKQPVVIVIPESGETPFEVNLGNLSLPLPSPIVNIQTLPATPSGVSASDGDFEDKIRVTWNESPGATAYEVYRANSFAGQKVKVVTITNTPYDDTTLPCGVDYYYWVKAVNASGASDLFYSDLGFIRCPFVPEPQPVVMDAGDNAVTESEAPAEDPAEDPAEKTVALEPPTGVEASDGAYPDGILITWKAVPFATSYDVYRTLGDCCGLKIKIGSSYDTSYDDLDVSIGDYYYWIKANNATGTSEFSLLPDGGHIMTRPFNPTGVNASDGTNLNKVLITWDKAPIQSFSYNGPCCPPLSDKKPTTSSYEIYRARWSGAPKTLIGKTSALQFFDTDLECSTCCPDAFVYWVKAVNAAGVSDFSDYDSGYVYRTLLDPGNVRATDGSSNCVWVRWDTVSGAKKYDIYRADSADGEKIKICTIDHPCDTFKDITTTCPKIYYYWVKAIDAKGYTSCTFRNYDTGYCVAK